MAEQVTPDKPDDDVIFAIDMGFGNRLKVFCSGPPEDYTISLYDVDRDAWISVPKADWTRIVQRVEDQF